MIQNIISLSFRFILCLSLLLQSSLSYGIYPGSQGGGEQNTTGSDDVIERLLDSLIKKDAKPEVSPEVQESARILKEMGEALEANRLREYISSKPELKRKFDVLSLGNQQVEILDHNEKLEYVISFDQESNSSQEYRANLLDVDMEFNSEGKLALKGVLVSENKDLGLEKRIGLIHTFNDVEKKDIVDWSYDKELLVILHKKRGLVLYHITMARGIFLGSAPIPSISIPVSPEVWDFLKNEKNIKLEFIDRAVAPPVPLTAEQASDKGIEINLSGKMMLTAGDLLISHTDSEGEKHIVQVLPRKGNQSFVSIIFKMYLILNSLMQIRNISNNSNNPESYFLSSDVYERLKTVVSATVTRSPIAFFNTFTDLISIMPYSLVYNFLSYRYKDSDKFSLAEWQSDYQKIKQSSGFEQISKFKGKTMSSKEIVSALKNVVVDAEGDSKKTRFQAISKYIEKQYPELSKSLKKQYPKLSNFLKENGPNILLGLGFLAWVVWESNTIPIFGSEQSYKPNIVYNMVTLGFGIFAVIYVLGRYSIAFLKGIKGVLKLISRPLANRFPTTKSELEQAIIKIEQVIDKWGKKNINTPERLTGGGLYTAAFFLPLFERIFKIFGFSHLFDTLVKGVNPFRNISPVGKAGFSANQRSQSGFGAWPQWQWLRGRRQFEARSESIDLHAEMQARIKRISNIMAYYAVSGKAFDINIVITGPLDIKDNLDYTDKKLILDIKWVSSRLAQYIQRSDVDTTRHLSDWNIEKVNNDFYQKALDLAQEVKSISWTEKQWQKMKEKSFERASSILSWNTDHARMLRNYHPNEEVVQNFWLGLIMDHAFMVVAPLTPLTPRGDLFIGSNPGRAVDYSNTLFSSSIPHNFEVIFNIVGHNISTARQQLQVLNSGKYEKLNSIYADKNVALLYEPIERQVNPTNNEQALMSYIFDLLTYPFQWGKKIYEGKGEELEERVDAGHQLWKFMKLGVRFWSVTIPLMLLIRASLSEDSLWFDFKGVLYFLFAGFFIFGLPQIWVFHHHLMFGKKANERKEIINNIKVIARNLEGGLYNSRTLFNDDYQRAILDFKKLYFSSKKFQEEISLKINTLDSRLREFIIKNPSASDSTDVREFFKELIKSQTKDDMLQQMRTINSLLNTSALPTEINKFGFNASVFISLGVLSNLLFVYVSENSFSDPSIPNILKWATIYFAGGFAYHLLSSKSLTDHKKSIPDYLRRGTDYLKRGEEIVRTGITNIQNKCISAFKK